MSVLWVGMIVVSLVCGLITGQGEAVGAAAVSGAAQGVELCLSMAGLLCLWTGVMEVMRRCGLADKLSRLLRPLLRRLFPAFSGNNPEDQEVMDAVSANISANLLGLGNAATPLGLEASRLMARRTPGTASDALCMFVVCNTASIQLIPTTVAGLRSAAGCTTPFDILPAVWLASTLSILTGVTAVKLFSRLWPASQGLLRPSFSVGKVR